MSEQANLSDRRRVPLIDWALRGGIGIAFAVIGCEKFPDGTEWASLFRQIGLGQCRRPAVFHKG